MSAMICILFLHSILFSQIEEVGRFPIGRTLAITSDGKYVYYNSGGILYKWDISARKSTGSLITDGVITSLKTNDSYLFVGNGTSGIKIVDKGNFKIVSSARTDGTVYDLIVSSNYVYVADGNKGVKIYDIENIAEPKLIKKFNTRGTAKGLFIDEDYLYVADGEAGLTVIDIKTDEIKNYDMTDPNGYAYKIYVCGKYGYIAGGNVVEIVEISDSITNVGFYKLDLGWYGHICDVIGKDNLLFIACSDAKDVGVAILDISDPEQPKEIAKFQKKKLITALNLHIQNDTLFCACGNRGFAIVNVKDPKKPSLIFSTGYIAGPSRQVIVHKKHAILSMLGADGYIIDVSIPEKPKRVCRLRGSFSRLFMSVEDDYLYTGYGVIRIFDISKIGSPRLIGSKNFKWHGAAGMTYYKNHVYLAMSRKGVGIVDVSNPKKPSLVCQYRFAGDYVRNVFCKDDILYSVDRYGVFIVDISSPSKPEKLSALFGSEFRGLDAYVSDGYLYLAAGDLIIADVSDPTEPKKVSSYKMNSARDVFVSGRYAYVCDVGYGLRIVDVSNPRKPKEVGFYKTRGTCPWGVYVKNDLIYVADGEFGLVILKLKKGKKKKVIKEKIVGITTPPQRYKSPMWYYNHLPTKPFDYLIQAKRCIWSGTCIGIFDNTNRKDYIPFSVTGGYIGYIGCGLNVYQANPLGELNKGKIVTSLGVRGR